MSTYEGTDTPSTYHSLPLLRRSFDTDFVILRPVEHNTTDPSVTRPAQRHQRPDLSTFFATLSEISPQSSDQRTRPHAVPVPADVSAAFYSLAEAFAVMRRGGDYEAGQPLNLRDAAAGTGTGTTQDEAAHDLLTTMIQSLLQSADMPPREVEGVSEEFCDSTFADNLPAKDRGAFSYPATSLTNSVAVSILV